MNLDSYFADTFEKTVIQVRRSLSAQAQDEKTIISALKLSPAFAVLL